ncbi:hypothetical protein PMAYCL1PPCAC_01426, partial [Pristionchus mayeri]
SSRMKIALLLVTIGAAWYANLLQMDTNRANIADTDQLQYRNGFYPYGGVCMYSNNENVNYEVAVSACAAVGAYAPSIHNQSDLDFWIGALKWQNPPISHFWLDAYCETPGGNYTWRDASPTDYLGPKGELTGCAPGTGYHIHADELKRFFYDTPASAVCSYDTKADRADPYCNCAVDKFGFPSGWNYNDIWVDVAIILVTSEAMGTTALDDAGALIESFTSDGFDDFLITDTNAPFYTRVGVIGMSDTPTVLYNLNMTKNDKVHGKASIKKGVLGIDVVA